MRGMHVVGRAEALDRCDLVPCCMFGDQEPAIGAAAVDVNRARATLAVIIALCGAGEVERLAQFSSNVAGGSIGNLCISPFTLGV
jgi:hypothetical protein